MALDPNDPMQQALYPVPPDLVWPPPEYAGLFTFAPESPVPAPTDPAALAIAQSTGSVAAPLPPPMPSIGPNAPIEETAGPTPLAADLPVTLEHEARGRNVEPPLLGQNIPGLGIPAATADAAMRSAPAGAVDPWAGIDDQGPSITDEQKLQQSFNQFGNAFDERAPEMPADYYSDQEVGAALAGFAQQDPKGYAGWEAEQEEKKRIHFAQKAAEAASRDADQQRANMQIREQAMKRADAMRAQVAQESENMAADGGFWDSRSDGQKVLGLLSIFAGALAAGPGGQNQALRIWERSIDQHVANAKRKLADKNSAVAQMYARVGDDFLANETMRQATMKAAERDLASQEQLYDPQGSTRRKIAQARITMAERIAASERTAAAYADAQAAKDLKAQIDIRKQFLDEKQATEQARHNMASERTANWNAATAAKKAADEAGGPAFTPEQLKAIHPDMPAPPVPMSLKDYSGWLDRTKKGQDVVAGSSATGMGKEQLEREVILPGGKRFIARGTPEEIGGLRKRLAATETVVRVMDEALRIRTGWTSDTAKSDEWRQLKANWATAKGVAKDVLGLGALSGPDMELVEEFIGTGDPTEFRDPEAGILKARENLIGLTRDAVKGAGGPKDWDVKYIKPEPPKPTASDRLFQKAQEPVTLTKLISVAGEQGKKLSTDDLARLYTAPGESPSHRTAVLPDVRAYLERLETSAQSKDAKESEDATAALMKLLSSDANAGVKAHAARALLALPENASGPMQRLLAPYVEAAK